LSAKIDIWPLLPLKQLTSLANEVTFNGLVACKTTTVSWDDEPPASITLATYVPGNKL